MRKHRRKILTRTVEWGALSLLVLDIVLYAAVLRPLWRLEAGEREELAATRLRLKDERARVEILKKNLAALPAADESIKSFLEKHVPSRRRGYSSALQLVRKLCQQSGVENSGVTYRLNAPNGEPLESMGIDVTVEGPFRDVLKFAHSLEIANDFLLVREFSFQPADNGRLALRVGAEMYLEP
jgi:Tfp pilus assembly protein PilO